MWPEVTDKHPTSTASARSSELPTKLPHLRELYFSSPKPWGWGHWDNHSHPWYLSQLRKLHRHYTKMSTWKWSYCHVTSISGCITRTKSFTVKTTLWNWWKQLAGAHKSVMGHKKNKKKHDYLQWSTIQKWKLIHWWFVWKTMKCEKIRQLITLTRQFFVIWMKKSARGKNL